MKIKKQQKLKQESHPNSLSMVELISMEPCRGWRRQGYAGQTKGKEARQVGDLEALGDGNHGDVLS